MTSEPLVTDLQLPINIDKVNGISLQTILNPCDLKNSDLVGLLTARGKELQNLMLVANQIRELQVGDEVSFVINRNINFTNICIGSCKFCNFKVGPNVLIGKKELSFEEIEMRVLEAKELRATEICMQGGLSPTLTLDFYIDLLKTVKKVDPKIHIHAFSPEEILHISKNSGQTPTEVISTLKSNGLDSMPGTAAEILVDEVRNIISPRKLNTAKWIEIIKTAHNLSIPTSSTMMYGHIETSDQIAQHFRVLRNIQEETSGFTEFVPLPFIHQNTVLYNKLNARPGSTGFEDIAMYSTARIFLGDKIPNLQSSWVKSGQKFAQFLLSTGVNDMGGTLMEESISKSAGAKYGEYLEGDNFVRLIQDAGRVAVQRDTLYNIIKRY